MRQPSKFLVAILWATTSAATAAGGSSAATASRIPQRKEIAAVMRKVNAWQMANPVMPAGDRDWQRGTWYTGVMAAWRATRDREYLDQATRWGREHQWLVGKERLGANRLFCSETWLELYLLKKDRGMIDPTIRWLDTKAPNSPAGEKRWYLDRGYSYVDSLYGAPALAMLFKVTRDKRYLEVMHAFFRDVTGELFDKQDGLYYRDYRYIGKTTKNGKKIFWSRGNGWAFAGLAKVLEHLPKDDPARREYVDVYRRIASELVKRQGPDGLWRPNLDDPDEIPVPETSGTGFFAFGLAWGINHGYFERATYLPAVRKAWAGLCDNVSPEGKVLWGQQVDGQPNPVKKESTHEYVTGTFLLAGSEVYKLAGK
jgi:rhamnogalacturonyl hydrolase YesR